jgi:hypothetical protein
MQCGQAKGLPGEISLKTLTSQLNDGQTDAVGGNAVTQCYIGQIRLTAVDAQARITTPCLEGLQMTDGLDNTGKSMRLRLGASTQFQNGITGFVDFATLMANSRWCSHNLSLGVRMEF